MTSNEFIKNSVASHIANLREQVMTQLVKLLRQYPEVEPEALGEISNLILDAYKKGFDEGSTTAQELTMLIMEGNK